MSVVLIRCVRWNVQLLIELSEQILLRLVRCTAPVVEHCTVFSCRIRERFPFPFSHLFHTESSLDLLVTGSWKSIQFRFDSGIAINRIVRKCIPTSVCWQQRRCIFVVVVEESEHFPMHSFRPFDRSGSTVYQRIYWLTKRMNNSGSLNPPIENSLFPAIQHSLFG